MSETGKNSTASVYFYFSTLIFILPLVAPNGYLVDFTTSFMLKNQLHATASEVSFFRLVTAIPAYLAVFFGLTRDLWNPLGLRDRGFLLIFAPLTAAQLILLAVIPLSYTGLLLGMLGMTVSFRFVLVAYSGLIALIGQERQMTGRLSVLLGIGASVPAILGATISGYLADQLSSGQIFLLVGVITLFVGLLGFWKPASVFGTTYDQPLAQGTNLRGDIKRLLRHRAIYPAVLITLLWEFGPAQNTVLQYFLTDELHASDAMYGYFFGIFIASFVPMFFLYGYLCKRVKLKTLLIWGTIIGIPQMIPLLFIQSGEQALFMAALMGLMGGIASASYRDLSIRSCPPGLQGTLMALVGAGDILALRGGDMLGSSIYGANPGNGFLYCVILTTIIYALILPVLLFIPNEIVATADDERNPILERQVLAEIAVEA